MRLIQNMTTIAEYPALEYSVPNRAIKIAVIGGSGVGKTGKNCACKPRVVVYRQRGHRVMYFVQYCCYLSV